MHVQAAEMNASSKRRALIPRLAGPALSHRVFGLLPMSSPGFANTPGNEDEPHGQGGVAVCAEECIFGAGGSPASGGDSWFVKFIDCKVVPCSP
jgi:hypothetical protein